MREREREREREKERGEGKEGERDALIYIDTGTKHQTSRQ